MKASVHVEEIMATVVPRTRESHSHDVVVIWCHINLNVAISISNMLSWNSGGVFYSGESMIHVLNIWCHQKPTEFKNY